MTWRRTLLLALAAALLAPATATAGFSSRTLDVSPASDVNVFPATATDARGQSVVVWSERTSGSGPSILRARRVRADGTMGAPVTVSDGTLIIGQRDVAMAPDGRALVLWSESATGTTPLSLRARWLEPDDTLGPQITVRDGGATVTTDSITVTATVDGDAVAAWRNDSSTPAGRAEARRIDASGGLGPLLQPTQGPDVAGAIGLEPDGGGGALMAWRAAPGIVAMPVDVGGAAGTVRTPVAAGVLSDPRLTAGPPGSFHLLWSAQGPPDSLATLTLDSSGLAAGTVRTVDPAASSAETFTAGSNTAGRSLAVAGHGGAVVGFRLFGADGAPEGGAPFTAPAEQQFAVDAAVLGDGTGVGLWVQGPSGGLRALVARTFAPDGTPGAPETLGPAVDSASFATNDATAGLVAWQERQTTPSSTLLQVRARQWLPTPVCADAAGTVVQGGPAVIALSCSGVQLGAPRIVTRPSHGTLGAVDAATGNVVYTPVPGFDGSDSFTFRGVNPGGLGAVQTARIRVGRDTVKPTVARFLITLRSFRIRPAYRRPAARRPAFVLRLSEPATARIVIQRKRGGKRLRPFRVLRTKVPAMRVRVALPRRTLAPGSYRATVVVTDPAGNVSAARRIGFVVRR